MRNSPIIILGMHRSGTSMISRLMERTGLYMGRKKDTNNESLFFMKLNKWILSVVGAAWDSPGNAMLLFDSSPVNDLIVDRIRNILESPLRYQYMGWGPVMTGKRFSELSRPWGWKDPRNTLTLPIWLKVFPEAKVILVHRHGVDVANSLVLREKKILDEQMNDGFRPLTRIAAPLIPVIRGSILSSSHCGDLARSFRLWCRYMAFSRMITSRYPGRVLEIGYETFLAEPEKGIGVLMDFTGQKVSAELTDELARDLNASRAFAYRKHDDLKAFAMDHEEELKKYGYPV